MGKHLRVAADLPPSGFIPASQSTAAGTGSPDTPPSTPLAPPPTRALIDAAQAWLDSERAKLEAAQRAFAQVERKQAADVAAARAAFDANPTSEAHAEQLAKIERRAQLITDAARGKLDAPTEAVARAEKHLAFEERALLVVVTDMAQARARRDARARRALDHVRALLEIRDEAFADARETKAAYEHLARIDNSLRSRYDIEIRDRSLLAVNRLTSTKEILGPVTFKVVRKMFEDA